MKKRRHAAILELIAEHSVDTQEELLLLLRGRGFDVTQATVSRDMNELGLVKKPDGGGYRYSVPPEQKEGPGKFRNIFRDAVVGVDFAMNDVVVKCYSGMAMAAAAALDAMDLPGVVGTLAGDDTIFIVARTGREAENLARALKNL